jgi:hypothetical protein
MGLEWLDFPGTFLDTFCNICNDRPTMTGKTTSFSGSHWTEFNIFKFAILAGQTYRIMENHPLKLTRLILWNHPLHIYIIYIYNIYMHIIYINIHINIYIYYIIYIWHIYIYVKIDDFPF